MLIAMKIYISYISYKAIWRSLPKFFVVYFYYIQNCLEILHSTSKLTGSEGQKNIKSQLKAIKNFFLKAFTTYLKMYDLKLKY